MNYAGIALALVDLVIICFFDPLIATFFDTTVNHAYYVYDFMYIKRILNEYANHP